MAEVKTGLLKDYNNEYFLPRTIASQVFTSEGESLEECCKSIKNTLANKADKIELSTKMDKENPEGTGSFSLNRESSSTVGVNSVTIGTKSIASGKNSFASGEEVVASGVCSHAEGGYSTLTVYLSGAANAKTYTRRARKLLNPINRIQGYKNYANNNWITDSTIQTKIFQVVSGQKYSIAFLQTIQNNSNFGIYFYTDYPRTTPYQGYTSKQPISSTTNLELTIPQQCNYILIPCVSNIISYENETNGSSLSGYYCVLNNTKISVIDSTATSVTFSKSLSENSEIVDKGYILRYPTKASGFYSHAEGYGSVASGSHSHAEGDNTVASGYYSHAEGLKSKASGSSSHAEGMNTEASGSLSHAEGSGTLASGSGSHAEGINTVASGNYTHAEGYYTIATKPYQHVQGKYNIEDLNNQYVHVVGNGSSDSSRANAHTLDWSGNAWFAGDIYTGGTDQEDENAKKLATENFVNTKMNKENPEGSGSFSLNRKEGSIIGIKSVAEGTNTTASGNYSHAEGQGTTASGASSHTEGYGTVASGDESHAEGRNTTSSGGFGSHAEGFGAIASGAVSHAEGYQTTASGGFGSHTEGYQTAASGTASHAEGNATSALGDSSHAEGSGTTASKDSSHAEGYGTTASGDSSHAEGFESIASGQYSHAGGLSTKASGNSQTAIGKYNIEDTSNQYAFIVGNGENDESRSNAFTVDWQGNISTESISTNGYISKDDAFYFIDKDENVNTYINYQGLHSVGLNLTNISSNDSSSKILILDENNNVHYRDIITEEELMSYLKG